MVLRPQRLLRTMVHWAADRMDHVAQFEPIHGEEGMHFAIGERFGTVQVAKMDGVIFVQADLERELQTDAGPGWIGAPSIWGGADCSQPGSCGEGMIVGIHSRSNDLPVNPTKAKQLTNIRAAGKDDAVMLTPPVQLVAAMARSSR